MKHPLSQLFSMKRRLAYQSKRLGLNYTCELKVQDYSPAYSQDEGGTIYHYPALFEIKIENYSNYFFSVREIDGQWIKEGTNLNGKGFSCAKVYRKMLKELIMRSESLKRGA